jgi:hypothetical protein
MRAWPRRALVDTGSLSVAERGRVLLSGRARRVQEPFLVGDLEGLGIWPRRRVLVEVLAVQAGAMTGSVSTAAPTTRTLDETQVSADAESARSSLLLLWTSRS